MSLRWSCHEPLTEDTPLFCAAKSWLMLIPGGPFPLLYLKNSSAFKTQFKWNVCKA